MSRLGAIGGRRALRQRGLSLVEVMVGLTVGLLLVAGLSTLFANASRASNELEKSLRHIENARHALDLLAEDIALAGFYGTAPVSAYAAGTLTPCANGLSVVQEINTLHATAAPPTLPLPVRGYTPDEAAALGCLPDLLPGTPALALRRLDTMPLVAARAPADAAVLQVAHHRDDTAPFVASANGTGLVLRDRQGNPNEVRRLLVRLYYLARCSECGPGGDGIPTLKRLELRGGGLVAVPLAEGIEGLAFDYGLDTSGDGVPDTWIGLNAGTGLAEASAAAAAGWGQVVAVRLSLVSRNTEATPGHIDRGVYPLGLRGQVAASVGPFNDTFKRRSATGTVRLHTVAGLREAP